MLYAFIYAVSYTLEYVSSYTGMSSYLYILTFIHAYRRMKNTYILYSVWNWNELRREITSLDCSFHCDIPLNVKTIIHKEMKLFGNYLFSIRFMILYSKKKKSTILHVHKHFRKFYSLKYFAKTYWNKFYDNYVYSY